MSTSIEENYGGYTPTIWENNITPLNANNLNNIETGISNNAINLLTKSEKGKLLWENPSPNSSFSSSTITLEDYDYDVLEIYYYDWVAENSYKDLLCQKTIKGYSTKLQIHFSYSGASYAGSRRIRYVNDTTLQVDDGYRIIDNSTFNTGIANYWNVPVYIVGYKTGLFDE